MRLFERKLLVCEELMDEATLECRRCEREVEQCNDELLGDEALDEPELGEEGRLEVYGEIRTLEVPTKKKKKKKKDLFPAAWAQEVR